MHMPASLMTLLLQRLLRRLLLLLLLLLDHVVLENFAGCAVKSKAGQTYC